MFVKICYVCREEKKITTTSIYFDSGVEWPKDFSFSKQEWQRVCTVSDLWGRDHKSAFCDMNKIIQGVVYKWLLRVIGCTYEHSAE